MKKIILMFAILFNSASFASPYGEILGDCLVKNSTYSDRSTVRKMNMSIMLVHPDLKELNKTTEEDRVKFKKEAYEVLKNIYMIHCEQETKSAMEKEGVQSIVQAGEILGSYAGKELFMHPIIVEEMNRYFPRTY